MKLCPDSASSFFPLLFVWRGAIICAGRVLLSLFGDFPDGASPFDEQFSARHHKGRVREQQTGITEPCVQW